MSANTMACIGKIERVYGKYSDAEIRNDVGRFMLRRFDDHLESLAQVLDAIKESCPLRFGPPDVATISGAIRTYEDAYGVKIKPPSAKPHAPKPADIVEAREATLINMAPEAEAMGIDTRQDGWVATYCFALMAKERTSSKP